LVEVLKPRSAHPLLVPGAHIGEVDVAEHDAREPSERIAANSSTSRASIPAQVVPIATSWIPIAAACVSIMAIAVA